MWYRLFLIHCSCSLLILLAPIFPILNYWLLRFFCSTVVPCAPQLCKNAHSLKYIINFVVAWKEATTGQDSALSDLPHVSAKQFVEAHGALQFLVSQKADLAEEKHWGVISIFQGLQGGKFLLHLCVGHWTPSPFQLPGVTDSARKANNLGLGGVGLSAWLKWRMLWCGNLVFSDM